MSKDANTSHGGRAAVQFDADRALSRRTPLRTDQGEIGEVLVPAAYPAVGECSPMCVVIPLTAAVDQTDDPEKAHGTTNVGLSEGRTRTSLSAVPIVYRTGRDSTR